MAKRVQIVMTDDIDGTEGAQTVKFGLDGSNYEIDLTEENQARLRQALQGFVMAGRKVGRSTGERAQRRESAKIREWATANGYEVGDRGRVPQEIREAYNAATKLRSVS